MYICGYIQVKWYRVYTLHYASSRYKLCVVCTCRNHSTAFNFIWKARASTIELVVLCKILAKSLQLKATAALWSVRTPRWRVSRVLIVTARTRVERRVETTAHTPWTCWTCCWTCWTTWTVDSWAVVVIVDVAVVSVVVITVTVWRTVMTVMMNSVHTTPCLHR